MRDELQVLDLVTKARNGQKQAWDAIVERYSPLVWSICRRHQLGRTDAEDVGQAVWLQLVRQLGNLRDPAALPGWLTTTTRRECGRVLRARCKRPGSGYELDAEKTPDRHSPTPEHELLLAERNAALREAFARLPRATSGCSPCSSPTLRYRTPRSAPGSAFPSEASGPTAAAAWTSYAVTRQLPL